MCLIIAHRNLKTIPTHKEGCPSKDRKVYKVFLAAGNKYYSPYCKFKWDLDTVIEDPCEAEVKTIKRKSKPSFRIALKGFFHAFTNVENASKLAREFIEKNKELLARKAWSIVILEAIIPEGAKYYEGVKGDICSKSMKILNKNVPILEAENSSNI